MNYPLDLNPINTILIKYFTIYVVYTKTLLILHPLLKNQQKMGAIILRPIITEKINKMTERLNPKHYAFWVDLNANKLEIKKAIETMYHVSVSSVRTIIVRPMDRKRYSKGVPIAGKTSRTKKAYIKLTGSETIDYYEKV